jgi:hypothetical protein
MKVNVFVMRPQHELVLGYITGIIPDTEVSLDIDWNQLIKERGWYLIDWFNSSQVHEILQHLEFPGLYCISCQVYKDDDLNRFKLNPEKFYGMAPSNWILV